MRAAMAGREADVVHATRALQAALWEERWLE